MIAWTNKFDPGQVSDFSDKAQASDQMLFCGTIDRKSQDDFTFLFVSV